MNRYVFNSGNAPIQFAGRSIPARNYSTLTAEEEQRFRAGLVEVAIEGDEQFPDLWVRNTPERIPNPL
jgi:hypothetical protein